MKKPDMKWLGLSLIMAASLLMVFAACDPNNGGEGADFDDTLYYTKTDVDSMISALETEIDQAVSEAVDAVEPVDGTADAIALAGIDWVGRTPVGFNVPGDGVERVIVEITGYNGTGSGEQFYICFGSSETNSETMAQFYLPADGGYHSFLGLVTIPDGATTMYGWHDTSPASAYDGDYTGFSIYVRPKLWLK